MAINKSTVAHQQASSDIFGDFFFSSCSSSHHPTFLYAGKYIMALV